MGRARRRVLLGAAVGALAWSLLGAALAGAAIPASLHDPASCERLDPAPGYSAVRCDDGVPPTGGTSPNPGGVAAVTVPARYAGDAYAGLPGKHPAAAELPGADGDGEVALDVAVTLPRVRPGKRGYPLLFFMHGCCGGDMAGWWGETIDEGGERWHYNDAWFASRGYAVVTYTARGFVNGEGRGSTGHTQLNHRSFEINDYQHLACQVLANGRRFSDAAGRRVAIDPERVVVTGGSYGGGFSWLAATDPRWRCTADTGAGGKRMKLAAAAPKYGWTDLVASLVPTGAHFQTPGRMPATDGCDSGPIDLRGAPCRDGGAGLGIPKASIVAGLYASGKVGVGVGASHTTFSSEIDSAFACLDVVYPPPPGCEPILERILRNFLNDRSAYYQHRFFRKIARRPGFRVPIFNAATNTDPLFPAAENRRMTNRLRATVPGYPIQTHHGDYQHFTQNKAAEWGDLCGAEQRVCSVEDYPRRRYDARPQGRRRLGVTTRLNRFLDHYARPRLNRRQRRPRFDVTAALQVCPQIATGDPRLPGRRFRAPSFERLTAGRLELELAGSQTTTNTAAPNPHAAAADPVANQLTNGAACAVETGGPGPGVAAYTSEPLPGQRTMIGATRLTARFGVTPGAQSVQLNARLYDVLPDGSALLVDRGPRILTPDDLRAGEVTFELHGNAWRFGAGHRIRIELAQDDNPFVKHSITPSSLTLQSVRLRLPVREG